MSNEFIPSKKKHSAPPRKDPAELDGSLGYVSCTEIRNLWTHRIRALDSEIWPRNGRTPYRDEIVDFFVTAMIELMQKAQANYEAFCRRNPAPATRPAAPRAEAQEKDSEAAARYEARKAKLAKYNGS